MPDAMLTLTITDLIEKIDYIEKKAGETREGEQLDSILKETVFMKTILTALGKNEAQRSLGTVILGMLVMLLAEPDLAENVFNAFNRTIATCMIGKIKKELNL